MSVFNIDDEDTVDELIKEAKELPVLLESNWLLVVKSLSNVDPEIDPVLVMLTDMTRQEILFQAIWEDGDIEEIAGVLLQSMINPESDQDSDRVLEAVRPATVNVNDKKVAKALKEILSELKIEVRFENDASVQASIEKTIDIVKEQIAIQQEIFKPIPFLTGQPDQMVIDLHAALTDFYTAKTWNIFGPSNKPIRATWQNEQGQRQQCCATVMGEMGENFGLSLFDSAGQWAIIEQADSSIPVIKLIGGLERFALAKALELAPEDLAVYKRLGLKPVVIDGKPLWPIQQRFTVEGHSLPHTPLFAVLALLKIMTQRAQKNPHTKVSTLKGSFEGVKVHYPSPLSDDFSDEEKRGSVEITVTGKNNLNPDTPNKYTITAPANMTLRDIWKAGNTQISSWRLPVNLSFMTDPDEADDDFFSLGLTNIFWEEHKSAPLMIAKHLTEVGTLENLGQEVNAVWLPDQPISGVQVKIKDQAVKSPASIPFSSEANGTTVLSVNLPVELQAALSRLDAFKATQQAAKNKKETAKAKKADTKLVDTKSEDLKSSKVKVKKGQGMCKACGYVSNKVGMTKHQAICNARHVNPKQEVFRIRVSGGGDYWLDVDVRTDAKLDDIDQFLRGIWLECCDHLSEFELGGPSTWSYYDEMPKTDKRPLEQLLKVGQKFGYTYDMGSSTELTLQVQAKEKVSQFSSSPKGRINLLARNLPPIFLCTECGEPATNAHSWEYDDETGMPLLLCDKHTDEEAMDDGAYLPIVNSPRMGVCAYEGGNDDAWPPAPSA